MKWIAYSLLFLSISVQSQPTCNTENILKNIFVPEEPSSFEIISTNLQTIDKNIISAANHGKHFHYWVDSKNEIRFSDFAHLPKKESEFIILQDAASKDSFIIKEWGDFHFDQNEKKFVFSPTNSWDLQPGEIDAAIRDHTHINYLRQANPALQKSRVVKCTELLAAQARGDEFIKDSLMISGYVTMAGFVTANPEILKFNVHDKNWQKNALLLASDLTGNLTSSFISGKVVKPLIVKNAGILKDFTQRTATDIATDFVIKRPLFNAVNSEKDITGKKEQLGNKLVPYNAAFSMVRFFPKRSVQKWTIHSLPKLLLSSCLKDSKLNLIVGPRMIRLADQYAAGYIYMSGRRAWMNNSSEEKTEENKK